ncbi:MAG: hypothetical protein KAR47_08315, partial [Planctomycetes bacterium]|nr:hypothetical protein [Planctomycetota bacterium]
MNRRDFVLSSAGLTAMLCTSGVWAVQNTFSRKKYYKFESFNTDKTLAPVTRVTPDDGFYVHTYFDVCPFSPSERYYAVTKIPFQDKMPILGDTAQVCVIDLQEQTIQTVFTTKCWGYQTGANVNWGSADRHLYTNDVIGGTAVCVRIDLETGETKAFAGPLYHIAPDESCVIGFPHELRDISQIGYGVPPRKPGDFAALSIGAAKDEGIWRTDLKTGEKTLLVSLANVAAKVPEPEQKEGGTYYFWHSKFNRQGTRIVQVLRYMLEYGTSSRNPMAFTFNADGTDIQYTPLSDRVPVWDNGGGHPNWHPDGENILRCLSPDGGDRRYCLFRYDGSDFKVLCPKIKAGGHPSIEVRGKYLITDDTPVIDDIQHVTLKLINLAAEEDREICSIPTIDRRNLVDKVFRLDGHPAWSR